MFEAVRTRSVSLLSWYGRIDIVDLEAYGCSYQAFARFKKTLVSVISIETIILYFTIYMVDDNKNDTLNYICFIFILKYQMFVALRNNLSFIIWVRLYTPVLLTLPGTENSL